MGSHYISVGKLKIDKSILDLACPAAGYGETPPPPEIYCPAEGYIPDPSIYHEDPIITEAPRPAEGQIRLIVTDSGSRHIQFKCQVSSSKKYTVTVTGADDTVIETQTKNNNTVFSTFLPLGAGYIADGYTYFYVDIAPEIGYDLTLFQATINATYDSLGGYMIAAYFNAPEIANLSLMFKNNKRVTYIEFVSNANNLTTLKECCYGADELEKFVFPAQMNALLDVESGWRLTPNFKEFNFKDVSTPVLENMKYFLAETGLKIFVFPANIDSVLNLQYGLQNSKNLENVTLYDSAENLEYINYLFDGCERLKGKINYPEMPNLIDFEYVHRNNYEITEIQFLGNYNNLTISTYGSEMFLYCKKVKKIKYPEKLKMTNNYFNSIVGCDNLEYLILPKKWLSQAVNYQVNTPYKDFFLNFYTNPKIKEISTVDEIENSKLTFSRNVDISNLSELESFIQPNIPWGVTIANFSLRLGSVDVPSKLKYVDLDLSGANLASLYLTNIKASLNEIKNLLNQDARKESVDVIRVAYKNTAIEPYIKYKVYKHEGNILTLTTGDNFSLNSSLARRHLNYDIRFHIDSTANTLIFETYRWDVGTRVSFRGVKAVADEHGLELYTTYYVVASSGTEIQISKTLGGAAISFLKDKNDWVDLTMIAEMKVNNIVGNDAYINVTRDSPGYFSDIVYYSDELDFFDFYSKGFFLYYNLV